MGALISILIALVVIGIVLWLVDYLPLDPVITRIIKVVIALAVLIWLIKYLYGLHAL